MRTGAATRPARCRDNRRRTLAMTTIPRWTLAPVAGEAVHDAAVPPAVAAGLRRLADDASVPITAVLLAAHAKVLAALSGESEVVTGYVRGGRTLPCPLTTAPATWRELVVAAARPESHFPDVCRPESAFRTLPGSRRCSTRRATA